MKQEELELKAGELLKKCETFVISSIDERGFPRSCVVSKLKSDSFGSIWFSTGNSSKKTAHFRKNAKASACYYKGGDSVTLVGEVKIVEDEAVKKALWSDWMTAHFPKGADDPEYCVMQFTAMEATFWIEFAFQTFAYGGNGAANG